MTEIVDARVSRKLPKTGTRKQPKTSTLAPRYVPLVGESSGSIRGKAWVSGRVPILTKTEVRDLLPQLDLTFADEVERGDGDLQQLERRTESATHSDLVQSMAGSLHRLGWRLYTGGVGLRGTFAMADIVAIDGPQYLFVECLTKTAILKHGAHVRKLALAQRVPFLFVGELPADVARALPNKCWSIEWPQSPRTQTGEWVPPHFRRAVDEPATIQASAKKGRTITTITFTATNFRLNEDVSGFLGAGLFHGWQALRAEGLNAWCPGPVGHVPFERHGKSGTVFSVTSNGDSLKVRLGKDPVIAHLRGSWDLWLKVKAVFHMVGLPIVGETSRP